MRIETTGIYLPNRVVPNSYFVNDLKLDTTEQWIAEKTGILERRFVSNETTSDMAAEAARSCVQNPETLDMILVATTTPDTPIPSTATFVQRKIGAKCPAVDLNNACSGFLYALDIAHQYISNGTYKRILVIGADSSTHVTDQHDRLTAVFFGDAAGAAVVTEGGEVLGRCLHAQGHHEAISTVGTGKLSMDGKAIWNFATTVFPDMVTNLAQQAGIGPNEIDWIVPHQANGQMLKACADKLGYPTERVIMNVQKYGNTISATVPIALHEAIADGRIKRGDLVAMLGFGAGLAWGGMLLRY